MISALPDVPSRADPATFSDKGDAFLGALPTFRTEANTLATDVNTLKSDTQAIKDSAVSETTTIKNDTQAIKDAAVSETTTIKNDTQAISTTTAGYRDTTQTYMTTAEGYKNTALTYRNDAEGFKDAAQTAAAAAGAAAGLPTLVGNSKKVLKVRVDELGVEWATFAGAIPIKGNIFADFASNDFTDENQAGWLKLGNWVTYKSSIETNLSGGSITTYTTIMSPKVSGTANDFSAGIYFGSKHYLLNPVDQKIYSSTDGESWTGVSLPAAVNSPVRMSIANTYLIAPSSTNNTIMYSTDGTTWNTKTLSSSTQVYDVAYGNSVYVARESSSQTVSYSSTITGTWTSVVLPSSGYVVNHLVFANSLFVAFCTSGKIFTSSNGSTWTERTSGTAQSILFGVWDGTKFIAWTNSTTTLQSTDGITWSSLGSSNHGLSSNVDPSINIVYKNSKFYICAQNLSISAYNGKGIYWSSNGLTWDKVTYLRSSSTSLPGLGAYFSVSTNELTFGTGNGEIYKGSTDPASSKTFVIYGNTASSGGISQYARYI